MVVDQAAHRTREIMEFKFLKSRVPDFEIFSLESSRKMDKRWQYARAATTACFLQHLTVVGNYFQNPVFLRLSAVAVRFIHDHDSYHSHQLASCLRPIWLGFRFTMSSLPTRWRRGRKHWGCRARHSDVWNARKQHLHQHSRWFDPGESVVYAPESQKLFTWQ